MTSPSKAPVVEPDPVRLELEEDLARLGAAVGRLVAGVGEIGTDASVRGRRDAGSFIARLDALGYPRRDAVAIMDGTSGETLRRRISLVGDRDFTPRALGSSRPGLIADVREVLSFELPIILHRWAFDQLVGLWLGGMELAASQVISFQRSYLQVEGDLMVRVSKVLSDPRVQMGAVREQNVAPRDPEDRRLPAI